MDFKLPTSLVAQEPATPRDHAKLLVYNRKTKKISDDYFYNLEKYLPEETTIVVNNSKVEHCRLLYFDGKLEIFILEVINDRTVKALVRPGKRFRVKNEIELSNNLKVSTLNVSKEGIRTLTFSNPLSHPDIENARHIPLPPYIKQNDDLAEEYQTVYAKTAGSKASPTAGLHFTPTLKNQIQKRFNWVEITLHVGLGTFASLTEENINTDKLHKENYEIGQEASIKINNAKHITAVGTTSVRTLESAFKDGKIKASKSSTEIFIQPGYKFKRVNSLITNFHLPGTSLLYLVAAFVGSNDELLEIYNYAINQKYHFYSFGDAMMII